MPQYSNKDHSNMASLANCMWVTCGKKLAIPCVHRQVKLFTSQSLVAFFHLNPPCNTSRSEQTLQWIIHSYLGA
jgi:hypothetical protein